MKKLFALVLTLVFLSSTAIASADLPTPAGFVTDLANVLSEQTEQALTSKLLDLQQRTSAEIAVLTVESLQGSSIEGFSLDVARSWGIGTAERDNGLLILVAPMEREVRIEVGYGLEGYVTDAQSSWIIREDVIPAFREGDFDRGVIAAVERIERAVEGIEAIPSDSLFLEDDAIGSIIYYALFAFFFFLPWFAAIFGKSKRWWPGGVVGAGLGAVAWLAWSVTAWAMLWLVLFGLLLDYLVSKNYKEGKTAWWAGGRWGGGGGGGFGGFSGGGFGGGGASGRW